MKKIFIAIFLIVLYTIPASAVCSITGGACSFNANPAYTDYNPNSSNNKQKYELNKTNTILPNINNNLDERKNQQPQTEGYDASCQFGICLPKDYLN